MSQRRLVLLVIGTGLLLLAALSSGQPSEGLCDPNTYCDSSCDNFWAWCVENPGNTCVGLANGCVSSPTTPPCCTVGPGF